MKRVVCTIISAFFLTACFSQVDFIKLSGETPFRTKIKTVTDSLISYQYGKGPEFTSRVKSIDYVEYGGQRVVYYNYKPAEHDIMSPELQNISTVNPKELMKKGHKVFIPVTSKIQGNLLGNIFMRELLPEYNYWQIVNSEEEAEFILNFIYDEEGRDKVYFTLETRAHKIFYKSTVVKAETTYSRTTQSRNSVQALLRVEMKRIMKN